MSINLTRWIRNSEKKLIMISDSETCSTPISRERQVSHVKSHYITTGLVDGKVYLDGQRSDVFGWQSAVFLFCCRDF